MIIVFATGFALGFVAAYALLIAITLWTFAQWEHDD